MAWLTLLILVFVGALWALTKTLIVIQQCIVITDTRCAVVSLAFTSGTLEEAISAPVATACKLARRALSHTLSSHQVWECGGAILVAACALAGGISTDTALAWQDTLYARHHA